MMHRTKLKLIPDEMNNESRIDKKQIEILCDTTSKLIQICNKKELKVSDLKWQPHYSTVFKQLKSQLELILSTDSSKGLDTLNKIPYFLTLKNNIFNLFNSFAKFVQENGSLIGTKDHHFRKSFFMKVVHFQFLYFEILAYFPNGVYNPSNVKISKVPARLWWERKFGDDIFVMQDLFVDKFKEDFSFANQAEIFSFTNSINFTSTRIITTFEYDLFTRLYSPWEKITEVWRLIYSHPAYLHFSTYGDTKDTLSKYINEPGTYVFRISCKDLGHWTIGYVKPTKEMGQVKVDKSNLIEALVEGNKKNMYLYPNGEITNPDLSNINDYRKEIVVNNEDLKLYDCFEDYKECKICRELEKDLQLESCGHQICQTCYKLLRKFDKKVCPFCNQLILSTTKIVNVKDTSIYVDASPSKPSVDCHYMEMTINQPNQSALESSKTEKERTSDVGRSVCSNIYSNVSDDRYDSCGDFVPSVPPRPLMESKHEMKRSVIIYPPISHINNIGPSLKYLNSQKKKDHVNSIFNSTSTGYTDMTRSSQSFVDRGAMDDIYCEVNETDEINNTFPCSKKNSKFHLADSKDVINHTALNNQSSSTLNGHDDGAQVRHDDTYYFPNEGSIYCNPVNNTYMTTNQVANMNLNSNLTNNVEDLYCNPDDDIENNCAEINTHLNNTLISMWSKRDVERALRVAKNDESLAKEILKEFVALP